MGLHAANQTSYAPQTTCAKGHDMSVTRAKVGKDGVSRCRVCFNDAQREYKRKHMARYCAKAVARTRAKKFGVSPVQYAEMLVRQNGVCAICKGKSKARRGYALAVDHDHTTGQVRELLCGNCNLALGSLSESKEILDSMISYIEKWG